MSAPIDSAADHAAILLGMTAATFLAQVWQQRPLFKAQALPGFVSPITPAELRELAEDDAIPSRLVIGGKSRDSRRPDWQVEYGGFAPSRFKKLPKSHWTLLVSEIDHVWTDADSILSHFDFLPHWRRDDLMISLAAPGGSVGPHVDAYDVFLLQAHGTRHWSIEWPIADPAPTQRLMPDVPLRILSEFNPTEHYDCTPGDVLYLPPGIPHHGVATSPDCMTYSIGFRSPNGAQALAAALRELSSAIRLQDLHFADRHRQTVEAVTTGRGQTAATHQIGPADREALRHWLRGLIDRLDDDQIDRAFGRLLSRPLVDRQSTSNTRTLANLLSSLGTDHDDDLDGDDRDDNTDSDGEYYDLIEIVDGDERPIATHRGAALRDNPSTQTRVHGQHRSHFAQWPRDRRLAVDPALRRYWSETEQRAVVYIDGTALEATVRCGPATLERLCRESTLSPREWIERFHNADALLARLLATGRLLDIDD